MTKYFKVKIGYDENEFVSITEDELDTAVYCFMTDSKGVFKKGVVRGKDIIAITEDWHKAMGWNYGHKFTAYDHQEIRDKVSDSYVGLIAFAKERVANLIQTGQTHLIGKTTLKQLTS